MSFSRLLLTTLLGITSAALGANATPQNLAPKAKITADSEHSGTYAARFVADEKIPANGGCNGGGQEWAVQGIPYYGEAATNYPQRMGCRRMGCRRMLPPDLGKVLQEVAMRRCASCHEGGKIPRTFYTRVTNIEDNDFLLAPLSKTADGAEVCGQAVFKTKNDPDYQAILKVFEPITEMLKAKPRMDSPGAAPTTAGIAEAFDAYAKESR